MEYLKKGRGALRKVRSFSRLDRLSQAMAFSSCSSTCFSPSHRTRSTRSTYSLHGAPGLAQCADRRILDKRRFEVIDWLNDMSPDVNIPNGASEEELRARLLDGSILCGIIKKFNLGCSKEIVSTDNQLEKIRTFIEVVEQMRLPSFKIEDLEQGALSTVLYCLWSLKDHLVGDHEELSDMSSVRERWKSLESLRGGNISSRQTSSLFGEERSHSFQESRLQRVLQSSILSESSTPRVHMGGNKFHEVFQLRPGNYYDLPAAKITEMMKSNSLDNAPTQSLLSVVNGILDESIERRNGEIPHRVSCLLRKVVQEIERRISTQADHIRNQNNLIKAREEKYQSRIRVLETLANGTICEIQVCCNTFLFAVCCSLIWSLHMQTEKQKMEERNNKYDEEDMAAKLTKQKEKSEQAISELKRELEIMKKSYEQQLQKMEMTKASREYHVESDKDKNEQTISQLQKELETMKRSHEQQLQKMEMMTKASREYHVESDKEKNEQTISQLKKELETMKRSYEQQLQQMETAKAEHDAQQEQKLKNAESSLAKSERRLLELKKISETKFQIWNRKEQAFQSNIDIQFQLVKELRSSSHSIKHEVVITQKGWCDEIISFGRQLKVLTDAVENYHSVLAENRKFYNEIQELKGNIRVYCRIRPFLPGENNKHTIIDHIGDNGEVVVSNPSKSGKDGQKMFKFNKAYGQTATQEQVYLDTQPLVRSVLDGFNVCIFAYGQTGSGKTYTMTGPDIATEKEWGVNYRALNDLFQISLKRKDTYTYEVGVQMVEIYNEQVRDLLATGGSQKKLGVLITSHPSGLAVPDACMLPVKSTSDVVDVMQIGHNNRAVSATSLNERSSRSHSIVTIHVRGTDLKSGATSRGSLHLVDLAGSERVDRSEVTGDRLKEAQHINKSLAALGDVVFALSQKSAHVPYRNSKLTQVLQSSLGGHAKTLMFIQINPEIASFTESLSTLKFAERVSGVELGAAKSQKEGKDIRDLMEQVASLKDTIARKDEEIEQLQQIKGSVSKHGNVSPLRHSSSPRISVLDGEDPDQNENLDGEVADQNSAELELLGYDDGDLEERLSDISETDPTDGSVGSSDTLLSEQVKSSETTKEKMHKISSRVSKPLGLKTIQTTSKTRLKETLKSPSNIKKSTSQTTLSSPRPSRLQVKAPTK
ncbi:kinesin-like protein KIN-14C [Curcuma longa]|uniref:kinesin-like protein KIN-14C n=1 Tax=Curcuma longa TaxID=136217 RepID=UPI003D9DD423